MMRAIRLSIIAGMLVLPGLAGATTIFGVTVPDDPGVSYLAQIFGSDLFGSGAAGQTTAAMVVVQTFNAAVLALATAFFTWQLLTAVVQSAHSGSILGETWSSLWVPVRFAFAGIMMIPTGTGGTILLQSVIATVIKLGLDLGLATAVLAGGLVLTGAPITAASPPSVEALAGNVWTMAVCNATYAQYGQAAGAAVPSIQSVTTGSGLAWGVQSQNWQDGAQCGSINYSAPAGAYAPIGNAWTAAVNGLIDGLQPIATAAILTSRPDAPVGTVAPTPGQIAAVIATVQAALKTDVAGATGSISSAVSTALSAASSGAATGNSPFSAMAAGSGIAQQLASCGWACFGATWNTLAEDGSKFSHAVSQQPTFAAAQAGPSAAADEDNEDTRPGLLLAKQIWDLHSNPAQANWVPPAGGGFSSYSAAAKPASKDSDSGWVQEKVWSAIKNVVGPLFAGNWVTDLASDGGPNPLARLTGLGITVQAVAIDMQTLISVLSAVSARVSQFFSDGIGSNLGLAMTAMLASGTFLVDILPLMPAAIWGLSVIGWMIFCAEALVAAPLFALSHLRAGGEGMHGEAGNGYSLLLNLALRPALMAIGMVVGMAIFSAGSSFLSQLFSLAILDAATENIGGQIAAAALTLGVSVLISWVVKFCLFVSILTVAAERCFALIHQLPDTVLRWAGGSGAELGVDETSNTARNRTTAIVGAVKVNGPRLPGKTKPKEKGGAPGIENGDGGESKSLPSGEAGSQRG